MSYLKPYAFLFIATSTYAAILNTHGGRRFADERTAESVVIGVGLVLLVLRFLLPLSAWRVALWAFALAGLPMVGRSLMNRAKE